MSDTIFRVLLVEDNPGDARLIKEYLARTRFVLQWADRLSGALEAIRNGGIDAVLLDLHLPDSRGLETLRRLRTPELRAPVVLLTGMDDESMALEAVREGAQDYLVKGQVTSVQLVRALRYAIERQKTHAAATPKHATDRGHVLGFVGAKGGSGVTTLALHVATSLTLAGHSTILAELHPFYGTLSQQVGSGLLRNLGKLLELEGNAISGQDVSDSLCKLPSGLRVLLGPQQIGDCREISPEQAGSIVEKLGRLADHVVLDLPFGGSMANQAALESCDFVALVLEPDPASIPPARIMLQFIEAAGVRFSNIGAVVVNHGRLPSPMMFAEIRAQLGCEVIGVIPPATEPLLAAAQSGIPIVLSRPESNAAVTLAQLAERLTLTPVPSLTH